MPNITGGNFYIIFDFFFIVTSIKMFCLNKHLFVDVIVFHQMDMIETPFTMNEIKMLVGA